MQSPRWLLILAFSVICLVWGSTWLVIKMGLDSVPPLLAAGARFVVASAILYILIRLRGLRLPLDRTSRLVFLSAGVLAFGVPFAMVYWGEQYIPSSLSSILFASYPFIIAILSYFTVKDEPLTFLRVLGIILGFAGLVVIFWAGFRINSREALLGMGAIVGSGLLQAVSVIIIKKYGRTLHPFVVSFGGMFIAALLLLGGSFAFERGMPLTFDLNAVWTVLFLGIVGSVLTFSIYFWLLKKIPVVLLSISALITPVIAVFLGGLILAEVLTFRTYVGAGIVLLGVLVSNIEDLWKSFHMSVLVPSSGFRGARDIEIDSQPGVLKEAEE